MEEGISLCWDPKAIQGAYIAVVRPNGNLSTVVASAPTPWPHEKCEGNMEDGRGAKWKAKNLDQQQRKNHVESTR
eukprot:6079674-Prorocentrum_lima.AAC.1